MSKMKELYSDMIDVAMNCIAHGGCDEDVSQTLNHEFGVFFNKYHTDIIEQAKNDLAAFHNDMMHSVYSHEEKYGE